MGLNMQGSTLSMKLNDVAIPGEILLLILHQLEKTVRHNAHNHWASFKLVCTTFNEAIGQIEDKSKCLFYNDVSYLTDLQQHIDEQLEGSRDSNKDLKFSLCTDKKIIAVQQLGRQSIHHRAPLLTCDENFHLRLYELNSSNPVCEYNQHTAKLTVAISVGKHTISADAKGFVGIWSLRHFQAHKEAVTAIDYLSRSQFVTCGGKEVKFWDLNQIDPIKTLTCDGAVKSIQARSSDDLLVLTSHSGHKMRLTRFLNDKPIKTIDFNWDEAAYPFSICNEVRIVSPNKVVGVTHDLRKKCFSSVDFKEPSKSLTQGIISRYTACGSLSRAQYCMFFTKKNDQQLDIIISLEPAQCEIIPNDY